MEKFERALIYIGLLIFLFAISTAEAATINYGDVKLESNGTVDSGHFLPAYDLTKENVTIEFIYDARGLIDNTGAHAWAQLGVRECGKPDFNPTWDVEGAGIWLSTDYDWMENTFDGNADDNNNGLENKDELDLDDKLHLQKAGGHGEGDYNLPSVPPAPGNTHRFWFDRDGVDPFQALNPLAVDGGTFNTSGVYQVKIVLNATDDTNGRAYLYINDLAQGFETDGDWKTMELTPAGMTFTGNMSEMQVFYGLYGYGGNHSVEFRDIKATGVVTGSCGEKVPALSPIGLIALAGSLGLVTVVILRRR